MTLTAEDRLWRDQNHLDWSDEELEKIIDVFGSHANFKNKENEPKVKTALDTINKKVHKLFVDEFKTPYAVIPIDGHLEVYPINSKYFKTGAE